MMNLVFVFIQDKELNMSKVFIVEDDIKIRDELSLFLSNNGFSCTVTDSFLSVTEIILAAECDLLLLDLNLPSNDGHHICKKIRQVSELPIIIITSKDSEIDELMSMNYGADDYVTKPFNLQILLARMNSVLKRVNKSSDIAVITYKGVKLNTLNATLSFEGHKTELTKNELRILHVLFNESNSIVSRNHIIEVLWQSDAFVDDNTLTVNVNRIRKKLESIGLVDFIKTKRGQGYII